jgi:heme/copper-type cytochrome/quinol oxidase subunit 4
MTESCPVCGLHFLREAGYFLGAMYISYGLGVFTVLPVAIVLTVVAEWHLVTVLLVALLQTLVSVPLFFRYSRVIWLHADQMLDPR